MYALEVLRRIGTSGDGEAFAYMIEMRQQLQEAMKYDNSKVFQMAIQKVFSAQGKVWAYERRETPIEVGFKAYVKHGGVRDNPQEPQALMSTLTMGA